MRVLPACLDSRGGCRFDRRDDRRSSRGRGLCLPAPDHCLRALLAHLDRRGGRHFARRDNRRRPRRCFVIAQVDGSEGPIVFVRPVGGSVPPCPLPKQAKNVETLELGKNHLTFRVDVTCLGWYLSPSSCDTIKGCHK